MKIKNLNIKQVLTLQYLLSVSLLFIFFSVCIYFFSELYLEKRFYKRLQDRAIISSTLYFDFPDANQELLKITDLTDKEALSNEAIGIYEPNRNLFLFSSDVNQESFQKKFIKDLDKSTNVNYLSKDGFKMTALFIPDKGSEYWVMVSANDKSAERALADLKNILIVMSLVAILLIGLLAWYFSNNALDPINLIIYQLKEIFPKNLEKRLIHKNYKDELGILTNTLNQLLERAENSMKNQKMFVANISHELKNPLTKIFTQIELMEMKYSQFPEVYENTISLKKDTLSLIQLNSSILELASSFSDQIGLKMSLYRIDEILFESISSLKKWRPEYQIIIKSMELPDNESQFYIKGNYDSLLLVFKNLIDNACKFSNNETCEVSVFEEKTDIIVLIVNQGLKIPKEEIANIFQAFYRINATSAGKSGHGVGLAIVKSILDIHNFSINAYTTENGNCFEVRLKKSS